MGAILCPPPRKIFVIVNKPSLYNITMNHQFFLSKELNQYRYLCIVFYHGLIHFIEVVYESIFFRDVVLSNITERKFFFIVKWYLCNIFCQTLY